MKTIPFNKPYLARNTERYVRDALISRQHSGNRQWGLRCVEFLKARYGFQEVFLVPSGTAALEMGVMLAGVGPGDEVILPSYTFSSTATAVLMSGAHPVFCEIDRSTMNIDSERIEALITPRTKLIVPIDYAGVPCDIASISVVARRYGIPVMVDAAQSLNSRDSEGLWVGTRTELAAFSFHETKNIGCGEGGALIINRPDWVPRAHILQEKGTDRRLVLDGVKSKYGWVDKGSSYLLSDILAAMLYAQFEEIDEICDSRKKVFRAYSQMVTDYVQAGCLEVQRISSVAVPNSHAFYILLQSASDRASFLERLRVDHGVNAYIGYVPLHSFTKGLELGYRPEDLPITEDAASRIVRLPLYTDLGRSEEDLNAVTSAIDKVLSALYPGARHNSK
ncbi:MAG: dTDP-4-amino-4,6-dideoxygalactose transaminase [Gammaproteobacteria bacterium]|nr:dTDP-4-amino-4,6-dideoxygalactose transaminase [Gammaproteobacteria bacterium]